MAKPLNLKNIKKEWIYTENLISLKKKKKIFWQNYRMLFWLIAFLAALGGAIYFIVGVYVSYVENSVFVGLNPISKPMNSIPFPAVTLCNLNLAQKNETENVKSHKTEPHYEKHLLDNICDYKDIPEHYNETDKERWDGITKFVKRISQPCDKMLQRYGGLCCTFNMLPLDHILRNTLQTQFAPSSPHGNQITIENWNPEKGYNNTNVNNIYPFKSQGIKGWFGIKAPLHVGELEYFGIGQDLMVGHDFSLIKSNDSRICHQIYHACVVSVKESMDQEIDNDDDDDCKCLPSCFHLEYEKVISYGQIIKNGKSTNPFLQKLSEDYIKHNIIIGEVYFEIAEFNRFTRTQLNGLSSLLASLGGILGLFLGFSVLSVVEIIYHLTLKKLCKRIKKNKSNKVVPAVPLNELTYFKNKF
ncbi:hypothetical protein FQA39_LY08117 [Lamprigera yunnana]|nr:hypothetical protein FQA39_LY08117 [Lamprigera yunnana]